MSVNNSTKYLACYIERSLTCLLAEALLSCVYKDIEVCLRSMY